MRRKLLSLLIIICAVLTSAVVHRFITRMDGDGTAQASLGAMGAPFGEARNASRKGLAKDISLHPEKMLTVRGQDIKSILREPELIRHGSKYGVKIHAQAPSINLIKARIETEIAPIVGNEQQAKDLIAYIKDGEATEEGVWDTNIFGKSVEQIVEDGMQAKISQMTEDCQMKLQDTLQKIINDSNGGMICIII